MKYHHCFSYYHWIIRFASIIPVLKSFTPIPSLILPHKITRTNNHYTITTITNRNSQAQQAQHYYYSSQNQYQYAKSKLLNEEEEETIESKKTQKSQALKGVVAQIEKNYGRGSLVKLGSAENMNIESIKTGSMTLDLILGGGYPKGRIIEIYGPESAGKTTLALHAIASVQSNDGTAAFIDAEHALDPAYAENVGVNVDELFVSQPDSGEMALDIVDRLVRSNAMDVIVVDSVAALVPRAELEGNMDDQQIGLQARLMSKAMRKIVGSLAASKCTVIFLNQLRSKVGVYYGSSEVTSGGNALKFYASVRLDTRRKEMLPENQGIKIKIKTVKNKVCAPFQTVELDVLFGTGIDSYGSLLDAALTLGCVHRKGSWYSFHDENFAQGRSRALDSLREDEDFCKLIEKETEELMNLQSDQNQKKGKSDGPDGLLAHDDVISEETILE